MVEVETIVQQEESKVNKSDKNDHGCVVIVVCTVDIVTTLVIVMLMKPNKGNTLKIRSFWSELVRGRSSSDEVLIILVFVLCIVLLFVN